MDMELYFFAMPCFLLLDLSDVVVVVAAAAVAAAAPVVVFVFNSIVLDVVFVEEALGCSAK